MPLRRKDAVIAIKTDTMTKIELTATNIELMRKNSINLSKIFELHLLDDISMSFKIINQFLAHHS